LGVLILEKPIGGEARERITNASLALFSQKGYDATRVNDIADLACVNKALIYYYFKSKQDILDYMVEKLNKKAVSIAMDFIQSSIVKMIKEGLMDIYPDRFHFTSGEAKNLFLENSMKLYENLVDFVLENKEIIRILLLESLKRGKHQNSLFGFLKFMKKDDENPIFKTICDADPDFMCSQDLILFEFFFSIIPIVNFAAYFDEYMHASNLNEKELKKAFLRVYEVITSSLVSGSDILLKNNKI